MREEFLKQKRRKDDNRPDLLSKLMLAIIYCGLGFLVIMLLFLLCLKG
jgi:hypothetical protein